MIEYEVLHYPGDVTGSEDCRPGTLLGVNETGWPWEVLDSEFHPAGAVQDDSCGLPHAHTVVQLQTASAETVRAAMARQQAAAGPDRRPRHVRRQEARQAGRL